MRRHFCKHMKIKPLIRVFVQVRHPSANCRGVAINLNDVLKLTFRTQGVTIVMIIIVNLPLFRCFIVPRDAVVVSSINCMTSLFGGFPIFSVIGFMAHTLKKDVSEVVSSGKTNSQVDTTLSEHRNSPNLYVIKCPLRLLRSFLCSVVFLVLCFST